MPLHDWTRVGTNEYHFFHTRWLFAPCDHLNGGLLPPGYSAHGEQVVVPHIPEVRITEDALRPRRRIVIKHNSGKEVIAASEPMSPGNNKSRDDFEALVTVPLEATYTEAWGKMPEDLQAQLDA